MTETLHGQRRKKASCLQKWTMRFKRARHARNELSAQEATVQLMAIFAILAGLTPSIGQATEPKPKPNTPLKTIPREYRVMPLDVAMRHLRSPAMVTKRVIEAAERLKTIAPAASEFIDHCLNTADFSELSRCLVSGNEALTVTKLNTAANAWRNYDDDDPGPAPGGAAMQPLKW